MTERVTPLGLIKPHAATSMAPGKQIGQLDAEAAAWADAQPTVQRCADCPDWRFEGAAADGRAAFRDHLANRHPERLKIKRRRNRGGFSLSPSRYRDGDEEQRAAAMVEVARRLKTSHADGEAA